MPKIIKENSEENLIRKYGNSYFIHIPKQMIDIYKYHEKKFNISFESEKIVLKVSSFGDL